MPVEWKGVLEVASQMLAARMRDVAPCELLCATEAWHALGKTDAREASSGS